MTESPRHRDHPGDDALSALIDEQVEKSERESIEAHLTGCEACTDRVAALRGAAALIEPEPADELTRRRLIARALDTATPRMRPSSSWWRSPRVAAAAALAAIVAIGSVTVLAGDDARDDTSQLAGPLADGEGGVASHLYRGDLGSLDDPGVIRAALSTAVTGEDSGSVTRSAGQGAGDADAIADSGADGDSDAETDAEEEAAAAEPEPLSDERTALAPPRESDPRGRADASRCLSAIGDAVPDGAELALAATGRFQGRDAVALAFTTSGSDRILALVLARDDCSILSAQSFTR